MKHIPIQVAVSRMNLGTESTLVAFLISTILKTWPSHEDELACVVESLGVDDIELGRALLSALKRVQGFLALCAVGPDDCLEFVRVEDDERLNDLAGALAVVPFRAAGAGQVKIDVELLCARLRDVGIELGEMITAQLKHEREGSLRLDHANSTTADQK